MGRSVSRWLAPRIATRATASPARCMRRNPLTPASIAWRSACDISEGLSSSNPWDIPEVKPLPEIDASGPLRKAAPRCRAVHNSELGRRRAVFLCEMPKI